MIMASAKLDPISILMSDPDWATCFERLKTAMMENLTFPNDDPGQPVDGVDQTVLEKYARHVSSQSNPKVSLALTLPMALAACSVACQGGIWFRTLDADSGDWYEAVNNIQTTIIASSGYGKSTSLKPLERMLYELDKEALAEREKLAEKYLAEHIEDAPVADAGLWQKIYRYGHCPRLTADSGTPEGIRGALLNGGGVVGVMTAEPDVLQEINRYARESSGGSFKWLLSGFDGEHAGVLRAQSDMVIPRVCVPYVIMVQPAAFEDFNHGGRGAGDSAIDRGLYGRSWLVRVQARPKIEYGYGMAPSGSKIPAGGPVGLLSPLAVLRSEVRDLFKALIKRTNPYRVRMGAAIGWHEAVSRGEKPAGAGVALPPRRWLTLAEDAEWAYAQVQNLRKAMITTVDETISAEDGSSSLKPLLDPMILRITDQTMRLAITLTLSRDPGAKEIPGWAVRDAGLRLLPWLVEHWAAEMHRHREARIRDQLERDLKDNVSGQNLTISAQIPEAIARWEKKHESGGGPGGGMGFSRGEMVTMARNRLSRAVREGPSGAGLREALGMEFDALVVAGKLVQVEGTGVGNSAKKFVRGPFMYV